MVNNVLEEHSLSNAIDAKDKKKPMNRVKQALRSQLLLEYERIRKQVSDETNYLTEIKKEREDVGVELYGLQQQLSHVQKIFERREDEYQKLETTRKKGEVLISELQTKYSGSIDKYDSVKKCAMLKQADLVDLKKTLSVVLKVKEDKKNDIVTSKRIAEKTKEVLKQIQKEKETQDIYLTNLSKQIDVYETQIIFGKEQLRLQKRQTEEAEHMIELIGSDRGGLSAEKKQLLQQWNLSLLALKQRDQALQSAESALKRTQSTLKDSVMNLNGVQKDIRSTLLEATNVELIRDNIYKQIRFIEHEILKILSAKETNNQLVETLFKNIEDLKFQLEDDNRQLRKQESEIEKLQQKVDVVMRNRRLLEDEIHGHRFTQGLASKENADFVKDEIRVANDLIETEYEFISIQNDLARINVDILKTEESYSELNINKESLVLANQDLEAMIATFESEIHGSHRSVQSKMNKLDRLNRKHERMLERMGGDKEPLGPFEIKIKRLETKISNIEESAKVLYMSDSDNQAILMKMVSNTESMQIMDREMSATVSILGHQRVRLLQSIHNNEAALKMISSKVNAMHTDISRLNELIGRHTTMFHDTSKDVCRRKSQLSDDIDDLSSQMKLLREKIDVIQSETKATITEVLAKELEILEHERKVTIEKETYAVLHCSYNAEEVRGMEQEIHRMRHRLENLNREEENILREIENTIRRRDNIALKHQNKSLPSMTKKELSINFADAKNKYLDLSKLEREQSQDLSIIHSKISESLKEKDFFSKQLLERENSLHLAQTTNQEQNELLVLKRFEKQKLLSKLNIANDFLTALKSKISVDNHEDDQDIIRTRLAKPNDKLEKIENVFEELKTSLLDYQQLFDRLEQILIGVKEFDSQIT